MSYIDMNRILPSDCPGFHCRVLRSFWIGLNISIDLNLGKYTTRSQLVLHQFQTILHSCWIVGNNEAVLSTWSLLLKVHVLFPHTRLNQNEPCTFASTQLIG